MKVIEARGLASADITGKSDPYVIAAVGESSARTCAAASPSPPYQEAFLSASVLRHHPTPQCKGSATGLANSLVCSAAAVDKRWGMDMQRREALIAPKRPRTVYCVSVCSHETVHP